MILLKVRTALQINFLEFFEVLLGCAEVKNANGVRTAQHSQCELGDPDGNSSGAQGSSPILSQLASLQVSEHGQEVTQLS